LNASNKIKENFIGFNKSISLEIESGRMSEVSFIEHLPYLGVFIILVLGGLGFPFPEGVSLILCGFLVSSHSADAFIILPVALMGVLTGDMLSYTIGRKFGSTILKHRVFQKIVSQKRLEMFEEKFNRRGILFIFFGGRFISGIFLIAGIMRMPQSKLLLCDTLSALTGLIVWGGIGYMSAHSLEILRQDVTRIEHLAILIGVFFLICFLFYKKLFSKK
jgi:membrane protein DedA with SNARE-associated domain